MSLSCINSITNSNQASGTTLNTSTGIDVLGGDLLIAVLIWESNTSTVTIADTDSTNIFTMLNSYSPGYGDSFQIGYKLSALANDNSIFSAVLSNPAYFRMLFVYQFRPDSGDTISLDAGPSNSYSSASTSLSTASIDPSGTDTLIFCVYGATNSDYGVLSNASVGGVSATALNSNLAEGACFYRLATSDLGSVNGTATLSPSTAQIKSILSFVSTPSSSGNPWYYYAQQMRQKLEEKLKRRILIPGFAGCMRYGFAR